MTTPVLKDSFGQEVNVGDYVYFQVKVVGASALSLGRITKISPKGQISMVTLCTHGKTYEDFAKDRAEHCDRIIADYTARGQPLPSWMDKYKSVTSSTRLHDASSCVLVPSHVLPPYLIQALQE